MTRNLAFLSSAADAVFVAVGKPRLINGSMIKPGAAAIDIGINQIEVDGKMVAVGDADYDSCAEIAGWITPFPGGVGPVTVSILMRNTLIALYPSAVTGCTPVEFRAGMRRIVGVPSPFANS